MSLTKEELRIITEKPKNDPFEPSKIIWYVAAALVVFFANDKLVKIEEGSANNSEEISKVAETVGNLATVVQSNTAELNTRGPLLSGIDTYSDQSRLKDQQHDADISDIQEHLERLDKRTGLD